MTTPTATTQLVDGSPLSMSRRHPFASKSISQQPDMRRPLSLWTKQRAGKRRTKPISLFIVLGASVVSACMILIANNRAYGVDMFTAMTQQYIGCHGTNCFERVEVMKAQLETARVILGCNNTDVTCLQQKKDMIASIEERQAVNHNIRASLSAKAEERTRLNLYTNHSASNTKSLIAPALVPMKLQYLPKSGWNTSFPDLNVIGFPKAGTSQLYKILSTHADAHKLHPIHKEFCVDGTHSLDYAGTTNKSRHELQQKLFRWHEEVHTLRQDIPPMKKIVNGCLHHFELEYHIQYVKPQNAKYFMLFRHPADWIWAMWNFWIDKSIDEHPPVKNDWASKEHQYRSPELFHEFIVSDGKLKSGAQFNRMRSWSVELARQTVSLVGRENILFLRSEDMIPSEIEREGGLLDQVATFAGLDRTKFSDKATKTKSNCGNNKGEGKACGSDKSSGTYDISGNRNMLEETRSFINLLWREECKVWANEFGVEYADCMNAS